MLEPETLAQLESTVRERLEAAERTLGLARKELMAVRTARSESPGDDEHDPEGSTLSADWSRSEGIVRAAEAHRAAVGRAVLRLHDGTYGVCLRCERPIAPGRLEAIPEAEFCVACAGQIR